MKLKFSAEPKDVLIFIIYCFMLLYVIAIGELNILQFAADATAWGFNPIPAFIGDSLWLTLALFTIALIATIVVAKDHFWDAEKGFGFHFGKKPTNGYSKLASDSDMKKGIGMTKINPSADTLDAGGIPLINDKKNGIWVDNSEAHTLIMGSTGSGKTQLMVQPLVSILAKHGESMIITDPKGEIYRDNGQILKEKGYNIVVLNFRDPQFGNSWDPLALPYYLYKNGKQDKAIELLEDLGANIVQDERSDDPFWGNTGSDFFSGLAISLFEDAKEEEININSINRMTNAADERFAGSKLLNVYYSFKPVDSTAYVNVAGTINAPTETKGSILSVFRNKIKIFASRENMSEMLSHSDFDMYDIGRKKTAVFLIIQDEKKTYHALVTIFLKQCYEALIDVAQQMPQGKLPNRTNFILDEFANMPKMKDVDTMISAARSRNIRFDIIIQSYAALEGVYGKQTAEGIKGNCDNRVFIISSELAALEEISKLAGEKESKKDDKTASTPLLTVSDLQRMPRFSTVVLRIRTMPYKTTMIPFYEMDQKGEWGRKYPVMPLPERKLQPVSVFDIKAFTEAKIKEEQQKEAEKLGINFPETKEEVKEVNPVNMMAKSSTATNNQNDIDMDALIKSIDAKIAEYEAEEKASQPVVQNTSQPVVPEKASQATASAPLTSIPTKPESTKPNQQTDKITDDEFFDDFFNDEDE